jgi:hypothetical protein
MQNRNVAGRIEAFPFRIEPQMTPSSGSPLILDLNLTCPNCGYSIPPPEMAVVSPGTLRCPKCQALVTAPEDSTSTPRPPPVL